MSNIRIVRSIFNPDQIEKIEKKYSAKFVCETSVPGRNGDWVGPVAVFYTEIPHPEGSNYFGMRFDIDDHLVIFNAIMATSTAFTGTVCEDGEVIYSRHRHDFVVGKNAFIDGGRDYHRTNGSSPLVTLKVEKDQLVVWGTLERNVR